MEQEPQLFITKTEQQIRWSWRSERAGTIETKRLLLGSSLTARHRLLSQRTAFRGRVDLSSQMKMVRSLAGILRSTKLTRSSLSITVGIMVKAKMLCKISVTIAPSIKEWRLA